MLSGNRWARALCLFTITASVGATANAADDCHFSKDADGLPALAEVIKCRKSIRDQAPALMDKVKKGYEKQLSVADRIEKLRPTDSSLPSYKLYDNHVKLIRDEVKLGMDMAAQIFSADSDAAKDMTTYIDQVKALEDRIAVEKDPVVIRLLKAERLRMAKNHFDGIEKDLEFRDRSVSKGVINFAAFNPSDLHDYMPKAPACDLGPEPANFRSVSYAGTELEAKRIESNYSEMIDLLKDSQLVKIVLDGNSLTRDPLKVVCEKRGGEVRYDASRNTLHVPYRKKFTFHSTGLTWSNRKYFNMEAQFSFKSLLEEMRRVVKVDHPVAGARLGDSASGSGSGR